jgi:hypothetical protein
MQLFALGSRNRARTLNREGWDGCVVKGRKALATREIADFVP